MMWSRDVSSWPAVVLRVFVASWLLLIRADDLWAQEPARLAVTVVDQTGGVLPSALVAVTGEDASTRGTAIAPVAAGDRGVAVFDGLPQGRYTIEAGFPGFETVTVRNVRVRGGETGRRIVLPLERLDETVAVGRDSQTRSLDPQGDAFSAVLTREQIDALPDDPDELAAVLQAMAPPGATIRVDGFTGGRLPPRAQIRSIRLPRLDSFAAQNHGGFAGASFIDIVTQPGMGPFRMDTSFSFRDDALAARNPFAGTKGDERLHRYGVTAGGTIVPGQSSFSLGATLTRQDDTEIVRAALADGTTFAEPVRRPVNGRNFDVRFDQALGDAHGLRVSYQVTASDRDNLGIGGFSLPEHGYSTSSTQHVARVSESGPLGRRFYGETRLQVSWLDQSSSSALEAPTIQVLDAFTRGGAQRRGGRRVQAFEFASDLDYVRGSHSMRAGVLLEGGRHRSDEFSNYLGTWTYASLQDYVDGRPQTYTRRTGDPLVEFSNVQAGVYVQDDWRVARSVLLSYGVRYEAQTLTPDRLNLSPRVSASWSPFRAGHTTVRASAGWFHDWLDTGVYEQALRVDGFRQQELLVVNPSLASSGSAAEPGVSPSDVESGFSRTDASNRYLLDPDRRMPSSFSFSAGVDRSFGQFSRVSVGYSRRDGRHILAGVNLNAPVDGVRPDPRFANVVVAQSIGAARTHSVMLSGSAMLAERRRTLLFANYTWSRSESNTAGALALPALDDLALEWGRTAPAHRMNASIMTEPVRTVSLNLNVVASSGAPYDITTGLDANGDGVFNERPGGAGRNTGRTAAQVFVNGRLTWSLGFGEASGRQGGPFGGGPQVVRIGDGSAGPMGGFGPGSDQRYRVDVYASVQNLFNRPNYVGYSGVMTSPFFGQPTSVLNPRRLEIGMRFGF